MAYQYNDTDTIRRMREVAKLEESQVLAMQDRNLTQAGKMKLVNAYAQKIKTILSEAGI